MNVLHACLLLSTGLFCIGLTTALCRNNAILVLLGLELMLNAANINFIAFWRFNPSGLPDDAANGAMFVIFSVAVAAAEAAVGLALVIAIFRHRQSLRLQDATRLKG